MGSGVAEGYPSFVRFVHSIAQQFEPVGACSEVSRPFEIISKFKKEEKKKRKHTYISQKSILCRAEEAKLDIV